MDSTTLKNVFTLGTGSGAPRGGKKSTLTRKPDGSFEPFMAVLNQERKPTAPVATSEAAALARSSRIKAGLSSRNVEMSLNTPGFANKGKGASPHHPSSVGVSVPGLKSGQNVILLNDHLPEQKALPVNVLSHKTVPTHLGRIDANGEIKSAVPTQISPVVRPVNAQRIQVGGPARGEKGAAGKAVLSPSGAENRTTPTIPKPDAQPVHIKSAGLAEVGRPVSVTSPGSNPNAWVEGGNEIVVMPSRENKAEISNFQMNKHGVARPAVLAVDTPTIKPQNTEAQPKTSRESKTQSPVIGVGEVGKSKTANPNDAGSPVRTNAMSTEKLQNTVQTAHRPAPEIKAETPVALGGKQANPNSALGDKAASLHLKPIIVQRPKFSPIGSDKGSDIPHRAAPKTRDNFAPEIKTIVEAAKGTISARVARSVQIPLRAVNEADSAGSTGDPGRAANDTNRSGRFEPGSLLRPDGFVPTEAKPREERTSKRGRTESNPAKSPSKIDKNQPLSDNKKVVVQVDQQAVKPASDVSNKVPVLQDLTTGRDVEPAERMKRIENLASLADKIRARAQLLKLGGESVFEARLNPPNLGSVRVRLSVQGEEMSLAFSAERPDAVSALQEARTDLSGLIASQGYTLAQCDIEGRFPQDRWPQYASNPHSGRTDARGDRNNEEDLEDREDQQNRHRPLHYGYNTMDLVA